MALDIIDQEAIIDRRTREKSIAVPFFNRISTRFMLTVGVVVAVLFVSMFLIVFDRAQDQIISEVKKQAEIAFEQVVITRHWNTGYGGVYVEKTEGIRSNPYLEKLGVEPDIMSVDGRKYTLKNPALMTRELSDIAKQGKILEFHITSLNLVNPSNAPDEFEKEALMSFNKGAKRSTFHEGSGLSLRQPEDTMVTEINNKKSK